MDQTLPGCIQAFDGFFRSTISVRTVKAEGNQHFPGNFPVSGNLISWLTL
jgi:hypothetical protein